MAHDAGLGYWLSHLLDQQGHGSRRRFAKAMGVAEDTVYAWCSAKRKPGAELIIRMSEVLSVPLERLQSMLDAGGELDVAQPVVPPDPLPREFLHTSLITRDATLDRIVQAVKNGSRLITIYGKPGMGRRKLALTLATRVRYTFPVSEQRSVFIASLAPVDEKEYQTALQSTQEIAQKICRLIGANIVDEGDIARERDPVRQLSTHIGKRPALLVVTDVGDELHANYESLVQQVLSIKDTGEGMDLVVLTTSSKPLYLEGEVRFALEELEVEQARSMIVDVVDIEDEADEKLLNTFLTRINRTPLALQLVSGLLRYLAMVQGTRLMQIVDDAKQIRLGDDVAVMQFCYEHLSSTDQCWLARLSVFAYSFTEEAAYAVCLKAFAHADTLIDPAAKAWSTSGDRALKRSSFTEVLRRLVYAGWLSSQTTSPRPRFTINTSIRNWLRLTKKKEACTDFEALQLAHCRFYASLCRHARPENGWDTGRLSSLRNELAEIEQVLQTCFARIGKAPGKPVPAFNNPDYYYWKSPVLICLALRLYWERIGWFSFAEHYLGKCVDLVRAQLWELENHQKAVVSGRILLLRQRLIVLLCGRGIVEYRADRIEEAYSTFLDVQNEAENLKRTLHNRQDEDCHPHGAQIAREEARGKGYAAFGLGVIASVSHKRPGNQTAGQLFEQAEGLFLEAEDTYYHYWSLMWQGRLHFNATEYNEAETRFRRCLRIAEYHLDPRLIAMARVAMARVYWMRIPSQMHLPDEKNTFLREVKQHLLNSESLVYAADDRLLTAHYHCLRGLYHRQRGRLSEGNDLMSNGFKSMAESGDAYWTYFYSVLRVAQEIHQQNFREGVYLLNTIIKKWKDLDFVRNVLPPVVIVNLLCDCFKKLGKEYQNCVDPENRQFLEEWMFGLDAAGIVEAVD